MLEIVREVNFACLSSISYTMFTEYSYRHAPLTLVTKTILTIREKRSNRDYGKQLTHLRVCFMKLYYTIVFYYIYFIYCILLLLLLYDVLQYDCIIKPCKNL